MAPKSKLILIMVALLLRNKKRFALALLVILDKEENEDTDRRFWVRKIFQERKKYVLYHILTDELCLFDKEYFFHFVRMTPQCFEHLLSLVGPHLQQTTKMGEPISPAERLVLTLRFLASGDWQQALCFSFRISRAAICTILSETCEKLWEVLSSSYVRAPSTVLEWKKISKEFFDMWDMPHCIGAIDGKHIAIECPANSGSLYYNYKGFFNLVLLAICDVKYTFTLVDIGSYGSNNDCGILAKSLIGKKFDDIKTNLSSAEDLAGFSRNSLNYFLGGDEILPLKPWLLRPYPGNLTDSQKVFNYRLSRSRHTIENTFVILASRWQIF